jgi:hypothetical protein
VKFLSPVYSAVSGSIAGLTYAHNRGGLYSRARVTPTNPSTTPQQIIRNTLATLASIWDTLTTTEQDSWRILGINLPVMGHLGNPIHLSGQQWFQKSNITRIYAGEALQQEYSGAFALASITIPIPTPTATPSATVSVAFNSGPFDSWNVTGGFLLVFASRPQNPGISFFKGPFQLVGKIAGAATSPAGMTSPFTASVAGQKIFYRFRAQDPAGMPTTDLYTSALTT